MFDSTKKADAVRRHLRDGVAISELAQELDVQPSQIHQRKRSPNAPPKS